MTFQLSPEYPVRCARILAIHTETAEIDRDIAAMVAPKEARKRELAEELKALVPGHTQDTQELINAYPRRTP